MHMLAILPIMLLAVAGASGCGRQAEARIVHRFVFGMTHHKVRIEVPDVRKVEASTAQRVPLEVYHGRSGYIRVWAAEDRLLVMVGDPLGPPVGIRIAEIAAPQEIDLVIAADGVTAGGEIVPLRVVSLEECSRLVGRYVGSPEFAQPSPSPTAAPSSSAAPSPTAPTDF